MKAEKTHWKKQFNYDYLGAYSLKEGEEVVFTIKSISQENIKNKNGKDEIATVCHFKEVFNNETKPMILNKTNCKAISKAYASPYIEDWIGKQVKIYIENGIKAFGDIVSALRISPIKPKLPKLVLDSDNFKAALEYLKQPNATITMIKTKYDVSEEVEKKLLKA